MIPDLTSLVAPVAALVPAAASAGVTPLSALTADASLPTDLSALPALAEQAVTGAAGSAVAAGLTDAGHRAVELLNLSGDLEGLAEEAVAAVARAADDITVLAGQCAREVVALLVAAPLTPATGAAAVQIGWSYLERAAARVNVLGTELDALAGRVDGVGAASPEAPASPSGLLSDGADAVTAGSAGASGTAGGAGAADGSAGTDSADGTDEVSGAVGASTGSGDVAGAPTPQAAAAVEAATSALGTPYVWGGTTPGQGMDCSGLTQWAYGQAGVDIPRTADAQAVGPQVSADQLAPGDLAVWDGHVAMVVGDGMMIEAGDPVQMSPVRTENIGMGFHGFYRPTG